ncbi:MAG TPA: hypothetical protein VNJ01_07650 [Bacteriovoracaceae bacterium]|nr:hypothetical protein [Bacteriovoracaceae bacterium]
MVADDDLHLWVYDRNWNNVGIHPLLPGTLPPCNPERKAAKPDFEAMAYHSGYLWIFSSGSKKHRISGASVLLDGSGAYVSHAPFDLKNLYGGLSKFIPELNIEGAVISEDELILFQRGNGESCLSGLVYLDLETFCQDMEKSHAISFAAFKRFELITVGAVNDVPYSLTDAVLHRGNLYFLAVAEATVSVVDDGKFMGAVLGKITSGADPQLTVLDMPSKPEGICFTAEDHFLLVTDDDDETRYSCVYAGSI